MLVYRPEDAFKMNLIIFKFFGLWPSVVKNRTLRASTLIYVSLTILTVGSWILFPLVDNKEDKVLLFAAWYPYNATVDPAYGYTYASQTILLLTTASMNSQ
ncbi:uncharacterized protein LOC122509987, partial [Leptopilina heterotoma]|uniref:uncharacterized protein LOC122509987 n=1 Tax=Leptopilina heterotoma TaxID=63436 RepID=UPI001CA82B66